MFNGTFQYGKKPDVNFYIEYADLEFLFGDIGFEDVTVAGLTAHNQTVGLVNKAYWDGDEVSSGLLGLAYPSLTDEFPGTNATADNFNNTIEYDPVFTTLYKQKQIPAIFSLALERNTNAGYLAFGGLPPVTPASNFASTPILIVSILFIHLPLTSVSLMSADYVSPHVRLKVVISRSSIRSAHSIPSRLTPI